MGVKTGAPQPNPNTATAYINITSQPLTVLTYCAAADARPATLQEVDEQKAAKVPRFRLQRDKHSSAMALDCNEVAELRSKLLNATVGEGCCIPAVHALTGNRFSSTSAVYTPTLAMPDYAMDLENSEIVYSEEIEVNDYPTPVALLCHMSMPTVNSPGFQEEKERFIASVTYPQSLLDRIPELTLGQSSNIEWFRQRMGSLTASRFGSVSRFMSSGRVFPTAILQQIQNYNMRSQNTPPKVSVPSLKWGLMNEKNGRKRPMSLSRASTISVSRLSRQDLLSAHVIHSSVQVQMQSFPATAMSSHGCWR